MDERRKRRRKIVLLTLFIAPKVIMLLLVVSQFVTLWLHPSKATDSAGGSNFHPMLSLQHEFLGRWKLAQHQELASAGLRIRTNETTLRHPASSDIPLLQSLSEYRKLYTITNTSNATNHTVAPIRYTCALLCGGAGDRLHGIVQLFYHGLCLHRPLYIDWKRPYPLADYLEPNHLPWHIRPRPIDSSWQMLSLIDAPESKYLRNPQKFPVTPVHVRVNQWKGENATRRLPCLQPLHLSRETSLFRQAFGTLFRWSPQVLQAADRTRQALGLTAEPYVAVHLRTGRVNPSYKDYVRSTNNESTWVNYYQCAAKIQGQIQARCKQQTRPPIYLATDTPAAKQTFRLLDPSNVRTVLDSEVFHLDRSMRHMLQNASAAHLQVFVDLLLLTEATCLVVSDSKFSSTAQSLQTPSCAVRWDACDDAAVQSAVAHLNC